jgi:transposase
VRDLRKEGTHEALSNDLPERIPAAIDNRERSRRQLAARFSVNVSTLTRLLRLRRQTGSFDPRPHGGGIEPTLDQGGLQRLRRLVEETPDATLEQLRQGLGISGSLMIDWRGLNKRDIARKKKTLHATEQDPPEIQEERRSFLEEVESIEPERLVFADETGVTTAMTPAYGRAPRGERVEASAPAS